MDYNRPINSPRLESELLNRPIRRKLVIKEFLEDFDSNCVLVRRFSSECVCGFSLINRVVVQSLGVSHSLDKRCEESPMDVDSSTDCSDTASPFILRQRGAQQSDSETDFHETISILAPVKEPIDNSRFYIALLLLILLFTLAGIYVAVVGERYVYVNRYFQLDNIKTDLNTEVLQQANAIRAVVDSLEHITHWRGHVKVLTFIGGMGVGKTFIANIIKRHFYPGVVHEVWDWHLKDSSKQKLVVDELDACCCNLVVLEDLKATDVEHVISFVGSIPESQVALVIAIFNIQQVTDDGFPLEEMDETEFKIIRDELEESRLYYELVLFEDIEVEVAENWVRSELGKRKIDRSRHDRFVQFLLGDNQVKCKGLKGLHSKLMAMLDGKSL